MLRRLTGLPDAVDGVEGMGTVSKDDYDRILEPILDAARRTGRRLRFIYRFGPEFERFTAGAAWEDVRIATRYLRLFEGCAVVTDVGWIRHASRFVGTFMPCPLQVFDDAEMRHAIGWLRTLPVRGGTTHVLLPESGVIVVDVDGPLRVRDFDAVAVTADTWIEEHGNLRGLVVHARGFPGWQDLDGFVRHLRFVNDRHRAIRRIALSTDGTLTALHEGISDHFVKAETKHFGFVAVDEAVAWAGAPPEARR
jgi:hypothetical protein